MLPSRCFHRWILRSESSRSNCTLAWRIRFVGRSQRQHIASAVTGPTTGCVINGTPPAAARFFRHSPIQFAHLRLQTVERLQQPLAPLRRVRQQGQLLQLRRPALVHSFRFFCIRSSAPWPAVGSWCASAPAPACADAPALPHIPHLQARHPDPRKPFLPQQLQQMLRVPPVVFCFRTTEARILAASPNHNSMPSACSNA